MADGRQRKWTKKRKVAVGIAALIALLILYHCLQLWGVAILAVGLFALWKYAPLPHKPKLAASLVFAVVFIFAAASWNNYNLPPKLTLDNSGSDYTTNNVSSYTVTGKVASHKLVHLTIDGKPIALNSSHGFSYKLTNLTVGDNNYTLVATSSSGEDRETLTIHRDTKAEDAADNSSSSGSTSAAPATQKPTVSMDTLNAGAVAVFTPELTDLSNQMAQGQSLTNKPDTCTIGGAFNNWSQAEQHDQNVKNNENVTDAFNKADNAYFNAHQKAPSVLDDWNTDAGAVVTDITKWADAQQTVCADQVGGDPALSGDQQTAVSDYQQYQSDLAKAQADIKQL